VSAVPLAAILMAIDRQGRVLVGERRRDLSFLPGFSVFPGGSLKELDRQTAAEVFGRSDEETALKIAALRELMEEAGLFWDGARLVAVPAEADGLSLVETAARLGLPLRIEPLPRLAHFITPAFSPTRFDTHCFLLEVEEIAEPRSTDGELARVLVEEPGRIIEDWHRFVALLAPPTRMSLAALAQRGGAEAAFALADGAQGQDVYYFESIPGIRTVPLRTPTLPPATHTNCYFVGTDRFLIVDPATYEEDERAHLLLEIERYQRSHGLRPWMVLLTHHHGDHVGSANFLREKLGIPVAAHPLTAALLKGQIAVDVLIAGGDRLELGTPERPFPVEALHTPGHAPGHLVLADRRPGSGAMIVGDMIASIGTIIIDPPEVDMGEYLRQLARLKAASPRVLFPAHGLPVVEAVAKLDQYVAHRLLREAKVLGALEHHRGTPRTPEELLPLAYDDVPEAVYPLAARSCLAHLLKLLEEGRVHRSTEDHFAIV
jgi:glyoxylase-like metal-dependent hydrolase (beta-lactamase superfamily II)/8-oxo-dGTP pyrophosphatase MutT (NUDIX family)